MSEKKPIILISQHKGIEELYRELIAEGEAFDQRRHFIRKQFEDIGKEEEEKLNKFWKVVNAILILDRKIEKEIPMHISYGVIFEGVKQHSNSLLRAILGMNQ